MKRLALLAAVFVFVLNSAVALPTISGVRDVRLQGSVAQTTKTLVRELKRSGFIIRAIINHQLVAKSQGHSIAPNTEILLGYPDFDYAVVSANPRAALFLPLSMVLWQDSDGKNYASYWDPKQDLVPLIDLRKQKAVKAALAMSDRLSRLVNAAAGHKSKRHKSKR